MTTAAPASLLDRFRALQRNPGPVEHLELTEGTIADYHALAHHHYRNGPPRTAERILIFRDRRPTAVGRYLQRRSAPRTCAVLTVSIPSPCCQMRNLATQGRYRGHTRRDAYRLLLAEVRTISRVVVDPPWRGLGLSSALVREAMRLETHPYLEAFAAMGRVHPFLERAGMVRYDRPPRPEHRRLLDALASIGIEPWRLALPRTLLAQLADRPRDRALLEAELGRWSRSSYRRTAAAAASRTLEQLIVEARTRLLSEPVYYLSSAHRERSPGHTST
jgi:GNAT superfamily N-acetyltransferase